jgi:ATP-dependent Clp endopeptidase proteolytic subunit ClpP
MTDAENTVAKTQAEIDAEVEARKAEAVKAIAEAKKAEQEAAYFAAQTRRELATAEQEECELSVAKINLSIQHELRQRQLANDAYHHVYQFTGKVDDKSVSDCIHELSYWHRQCRANQEEACPITIVFYSPGGSALAGFALFDYIGFLRRSGHHVTTVCSGWAASMGAILTQAGDTRVMGPESYLLIHQVSGGAIGSTGDIEDTAEFMKKMNKRMAGIFAKRSTLSIRAIEARMERKDWTIDSDEALKLGLVDEVR